jgi:hypothetical protein
MYIAQIPHSIGMILNCAILLSLALLARSQTPAGPPTWPQQFHALLFQNRSDALALVDLYYDWPNGRQLSVIRSQLGPVKWNLEYANKSSWVWSPDARTCTSDRVSFSVLSPDWLNAAVNAGRQVVDGLVANTWVSRSGRSTSNRLLQCCIAVIGLPLFVLH